MLYMGKFFRSGILPIYDCNLPKIHIKFRLGFSVMLAVSGPESPQKILYRKAGKRYTIV
jgi:hypothetical protein